MSQDKNIFLINPGFPFACKNLEVGGFLVLNMSKYVFLQEEDCLILQEGRSFYPFATPSKELKMKHITLVLLFIYAAILVIFLKSKYNYALVVV